MVIAVILMVTAALTDRAFVAGQLAELRATNATLREETSRLDALVRLIRDHQITNEELIRENSEALRRLESRR